MAHAKAVIARSAANGPFVYTFSQLDTSTGEEVQKSDINLATAAAALDAIKPLIAALPGSFQKAVATITTV